MNMNNEKGFSLLEAIIVSCVFIIVMSAVVPVLRNSIRQQQTFEAKAEIKSYQRILEKVIQKSIVAVRPEHFRDSQSFVYSSDEINDRNPMGLTSTLNPPFDENLHLDFSTAGSEPSSFVSGGSIAPGPYNLKLNSFTLGVMKVDVNTGNKKLEGTVSRLLAARCVQNGAEMTADGATVDSGAPIKSTMKVLGMNRYPFISSDGTTLEVRCCTMSNSSCASTYPDFVPKIYAIDIENSIPKRIQEYPEAGNKESLGSGFIISFNQRNDPNYFRFMFYDLENVCQLTTSGSMSCGDRNPANHLKNAGVLSLDRSFLKKHTATRSFIRFGRVKKGFESSGVIILGE